MGARSRELILLLAVCALAICEPLNKTVKKEGKNPNAENFQDVVYDDEEILYNEDKPCPRDCICIVSQGYRIAKCNRLEVGTQKFSDDITDLVIENADSNYPIQLDDFIFKKLGLHQIATVKIVNSTIGSVGPNAFHGLNELYAVNLSNNKLRSLHPETFTTNKKLLLLTLSNNPLKFPAAGSEEYFLNASSVQELDISYCNMQFITANTFKNMPGLMYLNVAGNNLSNMDIDTFKTLLDLEELDLSDNNINWLPNDIFSENSELATLHIQRNPIDTVYGLQISDLLTLNAGQTSIRLVGPSMFNGMTYIANLNLSGNHIEKIHNQAFHKLVELNYLDLSYNNLDFISEVLIKENIELDIFKISHNPLLKHLPEQGFNSSVDQFNIYYFDASNCGLQEIYDNSLKTFTALSQVNLSGNKIKSISNKVFSRCPKLVEINLANNMLTNLDTKVFEKNSELGKLDLRGNPVKVLSAKMFFYTPALTWLDISHTELTSLWGQRKNKPTTILSNLTFLNVSHNRITEVKQNELNTLVKLRTLDISNNPLACSRQFEDLMTWLNEHNVSSSSKMASIANLARDAKEEDATYSWESLTRKVCGASIIHPVEPLPTVSDEETWEKIDENEYNDYDKDEETQNNSLSDKKVEKVTKVTLTTESTDIPFPLSTDIKAKGPNTFGDDVLDGIIDDDKDDSDDDEEGDEDEDDEEEDDSGEDYDDTDVDIKVKLMDNVKPLPRPKITKEPVNNNIAIGIKLTENDNVFDDLERNEYVQESIKEISHGHYEYLWPILIAILGALLLLIVIAKVVMIMCSRKSKQVRYNSAIIAAMAHPSRTKKDCGLVYQQLSEDLTGPKTPKLSRYQPLHNVTVNASNVQSYESSPFHHNNIVPEAV